MTEMKIIKSKQRVADNGEVFTPEWLVEAMLDLVKDESDRLDSRFLESACGSGNFLIIAYKELRKLEMKIFKDHLEAAKRVGLEVYFRTAPTMFLHLGPLPLSHPTFLSMTYPSGFFVPKY